MDEAVLRSEVVELLTAELIASEPVEESDGGEHVPERCHLDLEAGEGRFTHTYDRLASERVMPGRSPLGTIDVRDPRCGHQQNSTRSEDASNRAQCGGEVVDEVERLCEHDGVEGVVGEE